MTKTTNTVALADDLRTGKPVDLRDSGRMTKIKIVTDPKHTDPKHSTHALHPGAKIVASMFTIISDPLALGVAATIEHVSALAEATYPTAIAIYVIIVDRPEGTAVGYEVVMSTEGYETWKAARAQHFLKLCGTGKPVEIGPCTCSPSP